MPMSSCDDHRLELAQVAQANLQQARELVKVGDYERALECYLFAFDNSLAVSGWGGVRLSYIPSEIAQLGLKYPAATMALQIRRDAREKMILRGETDSDNFLEWSVLNRYLKDEDREFKILRELEESGKEVGWLKEKIVHENYEQLLDAKRYELLSGYFDNLGEGFLFKINRYETQRIFPRYNESSRSTLEHFQRLIGRDGARLYELALATNRMHQSEEIVKRILMHCNTVEAYQSLIAAAIRAEKRGKIRALLKLAKASLEPAEYHLLVSPAEDDDGSMDMFQRIEKFFSESFHKGGLDFVVLATSLIRAPDVQACVFCGYNAKVITSRGVKSLVAQSIAKQAVEIMRASREAGQKMQQGTVNGLVLGTSTNSVFIFDFDDILLFVLAERDVKMPP